MDCSDIISIISMTTSSHPGSFPEDPANVKPIPPGALFEEPERVKLIEKIAEGLRKLSTTYTTAIESLRSLCVLVARRYRETKILS